jgi:hypothetical protein
VALDVAASGEHEIVRIRRTAFVRAERQGVRGDVGVVETGRTVMRSSNLLAAAGAAALGFASVAAIGAALRPRDETGRRPAAAIERATVTTPAPACDRRARLDDLRKIEAGLAGRIEELTAADATARFLPPRDLPARFSGTAVRTAVDAAIGASGVVGRVDEVDCSAFPCLVVARYARADQLGRLQRELRHNPEYSSDVALVMPMGDAPEGGGTLVGVIVFPRTEPRAAEILAAFKRRRADALEKRVGAGG